MIRRLLVLGIGLGLIGLLPLGPSPAGAATKEVDVAPGNALIFQPAQTTAKVGDTVEWTKSGTSAQHNVNQNKGLFRSGNPTTAAFTYSVVFAAGKFPYHCEIHIAQGMTGTVKVPAKILKKPAGPKFRARWANASSGDEPLIAASAVDLAWVYDVQYKIGNKAWKNWFKNTTKVTAVFGKNGNPVPVKQFKGKRVKIRARTQDAATGQTSGWSPVRSIKAV